MTNHGVPLQESRKPIRNVHLEVRWRSARTVMPPLNSPSSPPSSSFPIPVTKRASLVARETGFFHGDVGTRGKGRTALFRPVMKDSPHACLIARLMVPNPTAEPIYHSLIMFNGASDTVILPVLSRCAAPTTGTLAIVAQCCWWVQLRPQIVRPNKEGACASLVVTKIRQAK